MLRSSGLILYLLVAALTAAIGRVGRDWSAPALGLPADFWRGFLQAGAIIIPLTIVSAAFLARAIVARAQPKT